MFKGKGYIIYVVYDFILYSFVVYKFIYFLRLNEMLLFLWGFFLFF